MSNFKLVKTAAALALGASVVTSAVATTDASAASKYKIKSGKLVYAKSGKVVKGYVTYKSILYKNGKKLTGLKGKTYYKAGKKATGTYKGAYYVKGVKKVTTGTYNKAYYVKGVKKVSTGIYNKKYYKYGKVATGTYKGAYYVKGIKKVTTGTYAGSYYVKGVKIVSTGLYQDRLYQAGKLSKGYALYKSILYKDSYHNEGLTVFEGKLYDGVSLNKGTEVFEGKLYNGAVLATGLVEHAGLFYNEGALANGVVNGVEYKDGVVVKYEVTEVKTINASEFKVTFSKPVSRDALIKGFYKLEVNGVNQENAFEDIQFADDSKTSVIVRLDDEKAIQSFTEGDKIAIQVSDDVTTVEGKHIERFASEVFAFTATDKPQLKSTSINSGSLTLEFDRPVSKTDLIKIDGKAIGSTTLAAVKHSNTTTDIAGKYVYTVAINDESLAKDFNKVGSHEVILFNTADTARTNAAVASTLTATYTVSDKDGIPEVVSVTPRNANSFYINFSEEVNISSAANSLVVKQGNVEYKVVLDANNVSVVDGLTEVNAYANKLPGKNAYLVVVPEEIAANETVNGSKLNNGQKFTNPLYINKANTATLDVTVNNFKDITDQVGNASTKQVTLSKNAKTPTIESLNVLAEENNLIKEMTVVFDQAVTGELTADDFTVKNADGVVLKTTQYEYKNNTIKILESKNYSSKFTVTLAKEKVKYAIDKYNVLSYNAEATENKETSAVAEIVTGGNVKYHIADFEVVTVEKKNIFTLTSKVELGESALDVTNYKLDNKALPAGTKVEFLGDKKTLQFTLPLESIKYDTNYNLEVSTNVKTKVGQSVVKDLKSLEAKTETVALHDNVAPNLAGANYLVSSASAKSTNFIEVTFDEDLASELNVEFIKQNFEVKVGGSGTAAEIDSVKVVEDENGKDRKVQIKLKAAVSTGQSTTVTLIKGETSKVMSITDNARLKNKATVGSNATASTSVVDGSGEVSKDEAAAKALADAKAAAKLELAKYDEKDYTVNSIKNEIAKATKAIDDATTVDAANKALDGIKAIENDTKVLAAAKVALGSSIELAKDTTENAKTIHEAIITKDNKTLKALDTSAVKQTATGTATVELVVGLQKETVTIAVTVAK
ncbi:hypothetical protein AB0X74_14345 [Kurthia gibsonii]|uniref:hypothetical protein n=1 Tax=Kurthia gibsonii TaxID=33946 RepID=UPI003F243FD6